MHYWSATSRNGGEGFNLSFGVTGMSFYPAGYGAAGRYYAVRLVKAI